MLVLDYFVVWKQGCFQKFQISIKESQHKWAPSGQTVSLEYENNYIR